MRKKKIRRKEKKIKMENNKRKKKIQDRNEIYKITTKKKS
jgi:hypothetical protein